MDNLQKSNTLREFDRILIQKQITKLTYPEIADILELPVSLVEEYAKEYLQGKKIRPVAVKAIKKVEEKRLKVAKSKQEKPVVIIAERKSRSVFKTKVIDLNALISVRIDSKTVIWIKPGQDAEKEKAKYLKLRVVELTPEDIARKEAFKLKQQKGFERQERLNRIKKSKYPSYYAL